jgi:hypothetical protein
MPEKQPFPKDDSALHGRHVPQRGWYDAVGQRFVQSPDQLPGAQPRPRAPRPFEGMQWEDKSGPRTRDTVRREAAAAWSPNPELEQYRALRGRDPEAFNRIVDGRRRMALGSYENGLRAYLAHGGHLPEGVAKPDPQGGTA